MQSKGPGMSLRQKEVCELTAKISAVVLSIADFLYMALLGMNIAVLPAAYVEVEAWGTRIAAGFSMAIVVVVTILTTLLAIALFDRSRMRWFVVADAASVVLLIFGTVVFSLVVRDSVVGTNALPACNAVLVPVLIVALVAAGMLEWERDDSLLREKWGRVSGSAVASAPTSAPLEAAEGDGSVVTPAARATLSAGQRERSRRLRVQHARRMRRVRH